MFAKPYRLKSNKTLKNTEKKYLSQRIQSEFPVATDEKVKELVPAKSATSCMKVVLHSGDTVSVYVVDGVPVMIDVGDRLVPTVCALWKVPDLVPTIRIHTPVLNKMQGGAPLYVPGVVTEGSFPQFPRGALVAACTSDNAAVGVVGRALMSSADLVRAPMGVCLETLHVYGDQLCREEKFTKIERPKLAPASYSDCVDSIAVDIKQLNIQPIKEEWPSLVREQTPTPVVNQPVTIPDAPVEPEETGDVPEPAPEDEVLEDLNVSGATDSSEPEDQVPSDMDGLLRWCLLSFLKAQAKHVELPLKTNLLYKNHLMPFCPPDRTLDVKKSSYKKMGKFLEAMQREGLVEVREIDKGVDALVAVNTAHPLVRGHRAPAQSAPEPERGEREYAPPQIRELYCVTANVAELFAPLRKGTALSAAEVRQAVAARVAQRQLAHAQARGRVALDHALAAAAGRQPQELVTWEELMAGVLARMTPSTEMRFADGAVKLSKSRLEPVRMQVVTRSGNKKVTLVSNLEAFGFSLRPLAHACQLRAGAACGVTRGAAAKADQLMLQGDQTHLVAKLLIEKYGLPKKFVEGADKALNKKK